MQDNVHHLRYQYAESKTKDLETFMDYIYFIYFTLFVDMGIFNC